MAINGQIFNVPIKNDSFDQPYDLPYTRARDGNSSFVHYGVNADQLPLKALDPETGEDFPIPANGLSVVWPLPQSPEFLFPTYTNWYRVLDRFYHPVADLHITGPGDVVKIGGGTCTNPMDSITVPLGTKVTLSAAGSSDADQFDGYLSKGDSPTHYFWDYNAKVACLINCVEPQTVVPPGTDAAKAKTNMDADRDRANTTTDQNDDDKITTDRVCDAPTITVTLMPWDDDHLFPFHKTIPSSAYVHPQSGFHQAILNCTPPVGIPTNGIMNLNFTVVDDPYRSADFVGLITGRVDYSIVGGTINLTGDRPQLPSGKGTYNSVTGMWQAAIIGPDRIAGFPNVEVKWLVGFTPDGKTIMTNSTYQVGTNGNLNNEDKPVTYKVTGTVTAK